MTIKIEAGKYYMTRDGRKVGPMRLREYGEYLSTHPWVTESGITFGMTYMDNGKYDTIGSKDGSNDIIAEWTDEAPLPYGHVRLASGAVVDLTAITSPFGLLDAETQDALRNHGGPYEYWGGRNWVQTTKCDNVHVVTHRVKPQPPAPVVGEVVTEWNTAYGFAGNDGPNDCKTTHRLTLPTRYGQLVPGVYAGPYGLTIKVEAIR